MKCNCGSLIKEWEYMCRTCFDKEQNTSTQPINKMIYLAGKFYSDVEFLAHTSFDIYRIINQFSFEITSVQFNFISSIENKDGLQGNNEFKGECFFNKDDHKYGFIFNNKTELVANHGTYDNPLKV